MTFEHNEHSTHIIDITDATAPNPPVDKLLLTTKGQKRTKKYFILEYAKNRPISALEIKEIAKKIDSTPGYIYKVLSQHKKSGKMIRGRKGRVFAHGKAYYQFSVMPDTVNLLKAFAVNKKTGMRQIGFIKQGHPCSCQIHANGHLIVWPHYSGWEKWLEEQFVLHGWKQEVAQFVVNQLRIDVVNIEGGAKPLDSSFLPNELFLQAEWGVTIVKDNTPEKNVLEVNLTFQTCGSFWGCLKFRIDLR